MSEDRRTRSQVSRHNASRDPVGRSPKPGQAAAAVLASLRRIIHAIHAQSSSIEAAVGLTGPQLWALREIDGHAEGLALGELAKRLALHRANAGRLVDRLAKKGLVRAERPENDRRFVVVTMTPKGEKLARRPIPGPAQADLLERLAALRPSQLASVGSSLDVLVDLLGARDLDAGPLFEEPPARASRKRAARTS